MSPVTELFVKSTITQTPMCAKVNSAAIIRGFAFSGAPDVAKVELSEDDGQTWALAELYREHDPYAWRLWSFRWIPKKIGKTKLFLLDSDF